MKSRNYRPIITICLILVLILLIKQNLSDVCFATNSIKRSYASIKLVVTCNLSSYLSRFSTLYNASVIYPGQHDLITSSFHKITYHSIVSNFALPLLKILYRYFICKLICFFKNFFIPSFISSKSSIYNTRKFLIVLVIATYNIFLPFSYLSETCSSFSP